MDPRIWPSKAGRPARTYIQQLCEDTRCNSEDQPKAMNDWEKWQERVRDIRAGGTTWWWWWYILYIKDDLTLNDWQGAIYYKTLTNQPTEKKIMFHKIYYYFSIYTLSWSFTLCWWGNLCSILIQLDIPVISVPLGKVQWCLVCHRVGARRNFDHLRGKKKHSIYI